MDTKKRAISSPNQNSASWSVDPEHALASPPSRKSNEGSSAQVSKRKRSTGPSLPLRSPTPSTRSPSPQVPEGPDSSPPTTPPLFVPVPEDHPTYTLSILGMYWVFSQKTLLFSLREVRLTFFFSYSFSPFSM